MLELLKNIMNKISFPPPHPPAAQEAERGAYQSISSASHVQERAELKPALGPRAVQHQAAPPADDDEEEANSYDSDEASKQLLSDFLFFFDCD